MWCYHPELLARSVPRYTSFPTAAEFHEGVGNDAFEAELDAIAPGTPVSLYLHIPYCHVICWYCGCNTSAANKEGRLNSYLDALRAEIDLLASRIAPRVRVDRIAFGGGSPNAIRPAEMEELVARLRSSFDAPDPILSIELDPRSLTRDWPETIARAGFQRASLGVQTFAPTVQRAIGRVQPYEMIERATANLRAAGVTSLNFDLMYGLPHQDLTVFGETLDLAAGLGPDRLAVFGYAHVPHLIPRQRRIDGTNLPDQGDRFAQAEFAYDRLISNGYEPVGFDHFALPGDPLALAAREARVRRNFQGFTDDPADILIGIGASAISAFPGLLAQNAKKAGDYREWLAGGRFTVERGIRRSRSDRERARIVEQLLCTGYAAVDWECRPDARIALGQFVGAGLARVEPQGLRLGEDALPYARSIAACFDPYRVVQPNRFSTAV